MFMFISLCVAIFLCRCQVAAHGGTSNYTVDGTWYDGWTPDATIESQDANPTLVQRKWITIDPIFQPDNVSIVCNYPGDPAPSSIPVRAGDNITAVYYYWLHTVGPMVLWMADCGASCQTFEPTKGKWFKIAQRGLISGTIQQGMWGQREFQNWDGTPDLWTETIPASLKPGNYLIRHEIIALHIAHKPQFYPECAHLVVSGDGDQVPGTEYYASIPGVWSMDQPEINIDVYSPQVANLTTYNIPGPPVWTGENISGLSKLVPGFKGPKYEREIDNGKVEGK